MKKLVITLGLVLVFAMSASAQDATEGVGITAKGFKVGFNMSNVSVPESDLADYVLEIIEDSTGISVGSNETLTGYTFGVFLTYNLTPTFAIQPELLYTSKGFSIPITAMDIITLDLDFRMTYLEIPVLAKLQFGSGSTKPFLLAGPAISLLMSSDMELLGQSVDIKDLTKSTDLGFVFGGGVVFPVGNGKVTLDGRYTLGLSNIVDLPIDIPLVDVDIKNTNLSFMLGYAF
jgi:opacity protein-like surface antigen